MSRSNFKQHDRDDPWNRVVEAVAAFVGVLVLGTGAYRALGLGWLDAFYQTLITVSTVGYGEIGHEATPAYRAVSSGLILIGVGIGLYAVGQVFGALMEGRLTDHARRSNMRRNIDKTSDHVIVCGWGQVGRAIAAALMASGESVVVIDRVQDAGTADDVLMVTGEATDDDVLRAAGIERARSLVVALDGESDNLFVTLSGRDLNPELFIVTRAVGPSSAPKLVQAGADRVVNPHEIGAARMSSFVLQPNVADFLGETMSDRRFEVRLGEFAVHASRPGSTSRSLTGRPLSESGLFEESGVTLLAVRHPDGSFTHHRDPDCVPYDGDVLIVLGTAAEHEAARLWLNGVR